jgi:hypothetical protein
MESTDWALRSDIPSLTSENEAPPNIDVGDSIVFTSRSSTPAGALMRTMDGLGMLLVLALAMMIR